MHLVNCHYILLTQPGNVSAASAYVHLLQQGFGGPESQASRCVKVGMVAQSTVFVLAETLSAVAWSWSSEQHGQSTAEI